MTEIFEADRPRLVALAYGFLGSHAEAEDIVQEAWLRFHERGGAGMEKPAAWLTTVVSRIALDRLRSAQRRRETYPGIWLPEPVSHLPDPEAAETTRSMLSIGFLHLLESLAPEERVVFVLREGFDRSYSEIADTIEKSEGACRQIYSRAKARLGRERSQRLAAVSEDLVEEFITAFRSGDEERVLQILAQDAVLFGDGGGRVPSVLNPIYGADKILRFFQGVSRKLEGAYTFEPVRVNGQMAFKVNAGEQSAVLAFGSDGQRITVLYLIGNPEKLRRSIAS